MNKSHRKLWRVHRTGDINRLTPETEALVPAVKDKLRIKVKAIGLNFADVFAILGLYSATPKTPFVPGLEYSGEVLAVPDDNSEFKPGDKVMGLIRFGAYASVLDAAPEDVSRLPDGWGFEQGAAYLTQTLTAWYALKPLGDAKLGDTVIIQSAAGGVGIQAMKLCRALGLNPIGTVRSQSKHAFLRQQGFDQVLVRDKTLKADLQAMLDGQKPQLVLDAIGDWTQKVLYDALAPTGRLIIFGAAQFAPKQHRLNYIKLALNYLKRPTYDPLNLITDNKSVMGFNLIWLWQQKDLLKPMIEAMGQQNISAPHVGKVFEFDKAVEAVNYLRSGESVGKVVLSVD